MTGNLNDVSFDKSILSKDRVKIIYSIPEFNYNGYIDIFKTSIYKKTISGNRIYPYVMKVNDTIDIDSIEDWIKAENVK